MPRSVERREGSRFAGARRADALFLAGLELLL
jgi:hypothetical protein